MRNICCFILSVILILFTCLSAHTQQVTININTLAQKKAVSPYIYGKNNSISDKSVGTTGPLTAAEWQRLRDMGLMMFRENGGNNATKYNWRRKLSSHPDWYNNVYQHDWDYAAASLQSNIPSAQGMWAFQLAGKAAKSTSVNFNDWAYNGSQYWSGCRQNLCGGGTVNPAGGEDALSDGNPDLYLENWNADSTTGIINHWFGTGGKGLDSTRIRYWSMDNEPEIWDGTHDDVWPLEPSAEEFMQMYFSVAKKARALFPGIKLVGPVPCGEWHWYNWKGNKISYKGKQYVWLEYFILRIAEEQQATGIRLLDVLDIHFYPGETQPADVLQLHRVFFDTTYVYPGANGVKKSGTAEWDGSINKEFIFKRCNNWLTKYIGSDHGVTFSLTETALASSGNANVNAVWYASMLGEFAKQGVEIFTPWTWHTGMSEVVHLFSHYGHDYYIPSLSSNEKLVSAYPFTNDNADSITLFITNRNITDTVTTRLNLPDFSVKKGLYKIYTLSSLPVAETFVSHTNNALHENEILIESNAFSLSLPPLSVTAVILVKATKIFNKYGQMLISAEAESGITDGVSVSSSVPGFSGSGYVTGFDNSSDKLTFSLKIDSTNIYSLVIHYRNSGSGTQTLVLNDDFTSPLDFPASEDFSPIHAGFFVLKKGTNTIILKYGTGNVEIDKIEIYLAEKKEFVISNSLIDANANDETKNLYTWLQYQFGNRIISGQTHDYYSQAQSLAGKSPMIRAGDFQHYTQGYAYLWKDGAHTCGYDKNDMTVKDIINWYNNTDKKGIVSFQWHWHSPSADVAGKNTFYTSETTFDITKGITPGTDEYNWILRDIDSIATQLKKLQNSGIPVLWRPLHEAGGAWFWWGAKGPAPCLALWDLLLERLKNYHQLHNLIWVWSSPEPEWYPGNDKVDILGYDSYPGAYNYASQKAVFDNLYMISRGAKMIAMTENGPIPDPEKCFSEDSPWLYFLSWSELLPQHNSTAHISGVYDNSLVLKLESDNAKTGFDWRSSLYPENWKPGITDTEGRFLHDFSYAGYHKGEKDIPHIEAPLYDVTLAPYNADNTGSTDVTTILQKAIDDAGSSGGGVVYLPAGTYKISAASTADYALNISNDSVILRGAGEDLTFIMNTTTVMRKKAIIRIKGNSPGWFAPTSNYSRITYDLMRPTRIIPVNSVTGFSVNDLIILTASPTDEFISEHKMTGSWKASDIKGVAFLRRIDSIDSNNNLIIVDVPTRYPLKTRDNARIYQAGSHISECGIEYLSIGNAENTSTGWEDDAYLTEGNGGYEVHNSHAIEFISSENCWVQHVSTYKPSENTGDFHLLSNGIKFNQSRFITVDSCLFEKPQYEGGGGNGYMFTLESNDCLIKNTTANHGRHNFDFKYPYSNGNVIHKSKGQNSRYASDFHMYFSMANLFDSCIFHADFIESVFRPYGSSSVHGYTSTQSVFYNTIGDAYPSGKDYIIDSRQFGWGYIIGTSGPASEVSIDPAEDIINGFGYNSSPRDFKEGIGKGQFLIPGSLYRNQLHLRKNRDPFNRFKVSIVVRDSLSKKIIPECSVSIFNTSATTNENGIVIFERVPEFFIVNAVKDNYKALENQTSFIYSDTTLTFYISPESYNITIRILRADNHKSLGPVSFEFGSSLLMTNSLGELTFPSQSGDFKYKINKRAFQLEEGIWKIESDTLFVIFLNQIQANLTLQLVCESQVIENARVIINQDTLFSNLYGQVFFPLLTVPQLYNYEIVKSGYNHVNGSVNLVKDSVITVQLSPGVGITNGNVKPEVKFWPNPASDALNIAFADNSLPVTLIIFDSKGGTMGNYFIKHSRFTLPLNTYQAGLYLLNIQTRQTVTTGYFIKQ